MSNMNSRGIDTIKNELLQTISTSDTISQFMEKCNNNFSKIVEWKGGPEGVDGDKGDPGVPTKPKVPIHVWIEGKDYDSEPESLNGGYEIVGYKDDELTDVKYQEGHLIILENAHVYILEEDNFFNLKPKFILALHSYNSGDIINGNPGYVHFAYANSSDGIDGFITDDELREQNNSYGNEPISAFNLQRNSNTYNISAVDMPYMGVYSDNTNASPSNPSMYTWIRVQGAVGATGPQGPQGEIGKTGDKGDDYTGHPYTIDLEGDFSTISIGINGTRLYDNDYCECKLHAYYGDENVELNLSQVSINLPDEYKSLGDGTIVLKSNESKVGQIIKSTDGKDAIIQFTPDKDFVFPKKTITFTIHVETEIFDENDKNTYKFVRDTVWMIKGISSTFELEIQPQYRTIKLFEDGKYYPEKLLVNVYKVEDGERTLFDFSQNTDFKLLYKNYNDNEWMPYINGVSTDGVSCLEFKVIRYPGSDEPEMWDYEDVWVVADGKSSHYYHADLGNTESMMILTTGEKINIGTDDEPIYCSDLRNESGYSITFEPKFYDGTEELEVTGVSIGSNSGEEYYTNGTFKRELTKIEIDGITKYTFTITKVPYGVEIIPMNFIVNATSDGDSEYKSDTVSFNVYISTLSNIYTLVPTVSSYNTSTGKTGDTIGCNVYKNNTLIETGDLYDNGLKLKYVVHDGGTDYEDAINYTEPLVYGHDDDNIKDEFTAKDVAIEFILYYKNKEVVKSTVPLIKDGIDGKDGDSWQYIFCRSPYYPFDNPNTKISDPSTWTKDPNEKDSNSEYLGDKEDDYTEDVNRQWYDDHKGVDSEFKYEYQSYRKWNKKDKVWGNYGSPTLYSNFSESGSGYSVLLSNPVSVIPVGDDDWSVNENNKNQEDSTLVYLYSNTLDMSKDPNVTITLPENIPHFKPIKTEDGVNKVIFTPVVNGKAFDFGSNSQYKLPITLTYSLGKDADGDDIVDNFTTTINWTLTPTKGLSDVEVFVDNRVVNISSAVKHSLKVGYYLISSNGTKTFIGSNDPNTNTKGYKIILTDDIKELSSGEVSNWQNAEYTFVKNGENRNCYVVLVDSEGNKLDYINITAVNNGKDGASPIHLELTQDYISVPCSADGSGIHPDYKSDIRSQMKLYNGDKLIENGITYSFKVNGTPTTDITTSNDGEFNIPTNLNLISGDTNIECIATYNEVDFHKILTIDLKETPYELELNKSVLTRDVNDGNKIIDKNIAVRVKYWMDGKWIYTKDGEVKANTTNGKENLQFGSPTGDTCDRHLMIEGSPLESNTVDTEVRISYYNGGDVELSYETIGIINNGKDGTDGKDGKDGVDGKDGISGVLKLSENMITVRTDFKGNIIDTNYTDLQDIEYKFLYNNEEVDLSEISASYKCYNCEIDSNSFENGKLKISNIGIGNITYVKVNCSYNNFNYETILNISKSYSNNIYKLNITTSNNSNILDISEDTNVIIKILVDKGMGFEIYEYNNDDGIKVRINGHDGPLNSGGRMTLDKFNEGMFTNYYMKMYAQLGYIFTGMLFNNTTIVLLDNKDNVIDSKDIIITHNIPKLNEKEGLNIVPETRNQSVISENNTFIPMHFFQSECWSFSFYDYRYVNLYIGEDKVDDVEFKLHILNKPSRPDIFYIDRGKSQFGNICQIFFNQYTVDVPIFDVIVDAKYKNNIIQKHFKLKCSYINDTIVTAVLVTEPCWPQIYSMDSSIASLVIRKGVVNTNGLIDFKLTNEYDVYIGTQQNPNEIKLVPFVTLGLYCYGLESTMSLTNLHVISVYDNDKLILQRNVIDLNPVKKGSSDTLSLDNIDLNQPSQFIISKDNHNIELNNIFNFDGYTLSNQYCIIGSIQCYNITSKTSNIKLYLTDCNDILFSNGETEYTIEILANSVLNINLLADTTNNRVYCVK